MLRPIFSPRAGGNFVIRFEERIGLDIGQRRYLAIDRRKIWPGRLEQLLEIFNDEIGLLEGVDAIAGPHDPPEIKKKPARSGFFETVDRLPGGGQDAGAVDP